jgi:hypothetical protein
MDLPTDSDVVTVVQLVRTLDCDSRGRGFESRQSPQNPSPIDIQIWAEAKDFNERAKLFGDLTGQQYKRTVAQDYALLLTAERRMRCKASALASE